MDPHILEPRPTVLGGAAGLRPRAVGLQAVGPRAVGPRVVGPWAVGLRRQLSRESEGRRGTCLVAPESLPQETLDSACPGA